MAEARVYGIKKYSDHVEVESSVIFKETDKQIIVTASNLSSHRYATQIRKGGGRPVFFSAVDALSAHMDDCFRQIGAHEEEITALRLRIKEARALLDTAHVGGM